MISNEVEQFLAKVCSALNSHNVDYIIVGGAAVSHYGYNRPSGIGNYKENLKVDLDFWYEPSVENYLKILDALDDLEVDTNALRNLVFDKDRTFLKIPHANFHTDFLPTMEGLNSFRASKKNAETINIGGIVLPVIAYDDLILNKQAVNRKIDQSDIDELDKIRKGKRHRRT
jgi:predicted nucleotidyltransferase